MNAHLRILLELASHQHGVVSREQASLSGVSPNQVYRLIERGELLAATDHVLQAPGSPPTPLRKAMTGVLEAGPGSVLSHHSALALWDLPGYPLTPVQLIQVRKSFSRRRPDAVVHSSRRLPPGHTTVLDGIPVTTPTRSLFDVAGLVHPDKLARTVDAAWSRRLTTGPLLHHMLGELAGRGRRGIGAMREVLADRGSDYIPPASALERRFHEIIAADGQPPMRRQATLGDDVSWLARVDAFDDEARLVVEVDGDRFHQALTDKVDDEARARRLTSAGYRVIRFSESQVWADPRFVAATTRRERQAGRRRNGAPSLRSAA